MKKKAIALVLILCMSLAVLAACGDKQPDPAKTAAPAQSDNNGGGTEEKHDWKKMNITYTTFQNDKSLSNYVMYTMQDKINERMDGAIQFEYYYSGTLCSNVDTLDSVISGVADMGIITVGNYPGRLPYISMFDQVGIRWSNTSAASSALNEFINTWDDLGELDDVKVFSVSIATPGCIASKRPIRTVDDFKGMTIRATATSADVISKLGATPVTLEWSECYEAMRNGMVEGLYTMVGPCSTSQIQEVAPYCTMNPFHVSTYIVIMNKDTYESIPDEQRALFDELANETFEEFGKSYAGTFDYDDRAQKYLGDIEELIFLDDDNIEKMGELIGGQIEDYAKQLDGKGLKGTEALEYIRELADKYNAMYPAGDYNDYVLSFVPEK